MAVERPVPVRNEWDYIRYGTIGNGERIVSTDPPAGEITVAQAAGLTSILVAFDQPNYVYINDIAVSVSAGVAPNVIATRRLDNGSSNTVEIVLDRPMPADAVTTFILTDASGVQAIVYGVGVPIIPATSTWGLIVLALGCLIAGAVMLRRRATTPSRSGIARRNVRLTVNVGQSPTYKANQPLVSSIGGPPARPLVDGCPALDDIRACPAPSSGGGSARPHHARGRRRSRNPAKEGAALAARMSAHDLHLTIDMVMLACGALSGVRFALNAQCLQRMMISDADARFQKHPPLNPVAPLLCREDYGNRACIGETCPHG